MLKLAGVKCTRPSAVSAEGATVAALAVHIADALLQARSRSGASRSAAFQHRGVVAVETEPAQRVHVRARLRRQNRLAGPQRRDEAHFLQALERGGARVAELARMGGCCEISRAEAGITVGRADDPVEVVFACHAREEVPVLVLTPG